MVEWKNRRMMVLLNYAVPGNKKSRLMKEQVPRRISSNAGLKVLILSDIPEVNLLFETY